MFWRIISDLVCVIIGCVVGILVRQYYIKKSLASFVEEEMKKQQASEEDDSWMD